MLAARFCCSSTEYLTRGGDEFIAILPRSDGAAAHALLERLAAAWSAMRPQPIKFSAGVATSDGEPSAVVVAHADDDLYRVKAIRHQTPFSLHLSAA